MSSIILVLVILVILFLLGYYKPQIAGWWGEKKVSTLLSLLRSDYYSAYNDVLVQVDGKSSQIDHVVVSPFGVFVIETKNYKGWIYGGATSEYWTQNLWGRKESLYNPILQNKGHIAALKKVLPMYHENQFISIVVFSSKASLRSHLPRELNVITTWDLIFRIRSYKDQILSVDEVADLEHKVDMLTVFGKEEKKSHVQFAKATAYQNYQRMEQGICPKCGGQLVERKGKYGRFLGCSNYPRCTYTAKT